MIKDNSLTINLYVVYDKVINTSTKIAYAYNHTEAYSKCMLEIKNKIVENPNYTVDDFDIVYVGIFHHDTGLIEPNYKIINDDVVDNYRNVIRANRERFLQDVNKIFGDKLDG